MLQKLIPLLLLICAPAFAADAPATKPTTAPTTQPFLKNIEAFEAYDAKNPPKEREVMFLGSSSIVKWKTLAEDFPGVPVINRGFGGSKIPDSVRYASRIVLPRKPKAIVFYAGDNDLAGGRSPEQLLADFQALVKIVHAGLPDTKIFFIAVKPSPSRLKLMDKGKAANQLIKEYCATDPLLGFIDVVPPMLDAEGKPRPELFVSDMLHMNPKGYEIWTKILTPVLTPYKSDAK